MATDLPEYYFRIRDNGAIVFRVDAENRHRRIEMDQIAVINLNRGDYKPHGDRQLSAADEAAITRWMQDRKALLTRRDVDDILRTVDHLNLTATWVQSRATPEELEEITDVLLLAMHDLRTILVRKKAERLTSG
ncbi:MAG: hypothetical protein N4A53_04895 [Pelagimonas sp.]|jgi:hypothetical protein|nr:hypothetical protein [Pelagimonas sp.]